MRLRVLASELGFGSLSRQLVPSVFGAAVCASGLGAQSPGTSQAPSSWTVEESRSAMTDEPTVVLTTRASNEVHGRLDRARPSLIVRCRERKLDVYLVTGMSSHVEGATGSHTVRYRVDTLRAVSEGSWQESTDNEALFSPAPAALAERLMSGNTILFEWTPFHADPVQARFDVQGLEPHRAKLVAACPGTLAETSAAERAAFAASPEGRAAEAVAAFQAVIEANPRYRERMAVVTSVIEGVLGTRTRDTYVTTRIVDFQRCKLTISVTRQMPNLTAIDTAWVDLRTLAPSPIVKSQKPMIGWALVLATESGAKTIPVHHWMPRDREPKVATYATLSIPFDQEETAREALRLAEAAISRCRNLPM